MANEQPSIIVVDDDPAIMRCPGLIVSKHSETTWNLGLAIRHVLQGNTYYSPELARHLVELDDGAPQSRLSTLPHREIEVLRGVARGWSQLQIAESIGMSERTIHMEVGHLKDKLALFTTHELTLFAISEGLVFPELQEK